MQSSKNIPEVISHFECAADGDSYKAYGSGHINDTFFLKNVAANGPDYLLQRINHSIFTNVEKLTDNMRRVTEHLKNKIAERGYGDPLKEVMTLIPTDDQHFFYKDSVGDYWRMFYFLKDTKTYDVVETPKQAYEGGKAFGKFQEMLSDIPPGEMFEVIPDFHNIQKRLQHLEEAIANDPLGRLASVAPELEIVKQYADAMQYFQQSAQVDLLPKRVIHNDTKFNNVLLDKNDEAQCVIDLETVMDGYVAYDFGDAIRTIINSSTEDEADLNKIQLNMPLFDAYTEGYIQSAANFLTVAEINSLFKGVLLLPYMQAVRFLTDYINGDTYFKIKFEGHNLQRARAQFQLLKRLDANAAVMQKTILNTVSNLKKI
ncbi:phosphotransferase enzyme family protein [Pedobacter sp.]|uniref:phosphotransferase enzyme family protein n=1 Tax=Pedobacter sp. TaxID=1411316 RepID=UPI003D7F2935